MDFTPCFISLGSHSASGTAISSSNSIAGHYYKIYLSCFFISAYYLCSISASFLSAPIPSFSPSPSPSRLVVAPHPSWMASSSFFSSPASSSPVCARVPFSLAPCSLRLSEYFPITFSLLQFVARWSRMLAVSISTLPAPILIARSPDICDSPLSLSDVFRTSIAPQRPLRPNERSLASTGLGRRLG